jgi:hypothetical protein
MGGGPTARQALAQALPATDPALSAAGGGESGPEGRDQDFCALEHRLGFASSAGAELRLGMQVHLQLGPPIRVLRGSGEVGTINDPLARAVESCLLDGYQMQGAVEAVDPDSGTGVVRVTGTPT